ncbi:hypothetical protein CDD82_4190 [Ophiocordyceps australis]|uniref:DAGKc domain-containing protein n=1 Tax=Ophiocordyceps australis TaxID=1399860 RepID=A0A2C5Z2E8_9HYPO|nr:hypothetical protein CDD82_4190 [Ophiocordyceps australis]
MNRHFSFDDGVGKHLALFGGRRMTIADSHLIIDDVTDFKKAKSHRWCCLPRPPDDNGKRLIPLYNILWVELLPNKKLTIDYAAQVSKKSIRPETLTFEIDYRSRDGERPEDFVSTLMRRVYGDAQRQKRAYVLINPHAGPGGALRKWERDVKPIFERARMVLDVVILKRGGEAVELAEKMDINMYDTVVACSGDGTPHEIFNGLAKRADAGTALASMPVSHIPCGSGNAMACNLYGSHRADVAALGIIKGVVTALDLVSITQSNRRTVSFLSQSLGIVAESDLATEHLRWMGSFRFELGVMTRIFRRKCYPCDIAVKAEVEQKDDVREHYRRHTSVMSISRASGTSRTLADSQKCDSSSSNPKEEDGLPPLTHGTVEDELPADWELVPHNKLGTFYCGNMAYMAPDLNFFSAAVASDGCMDLVTLRGDLSPFKAIQTLMSVETGQFFDSRHVSYRKVSAYRIIPRGQEDGYISIDGERVPFEPFQAEVHRGLGRVISKRGRFEAEGPIDWGRETIAERLRS